VVGTPFIQNYNAPQKSRADVPQFPSTMPAGAYGTIAAANASQAAAQQRLLIAQQRQAALVAASVRAQQVAQQQSHYADLNPVQPAPVAQPTPLQDALRQRMAEQQGNITNQPPQPSGPIKRPGGGGVYVE
jgi:hypothetical protein